MVNAFVHNSGFSCHKLRNAFRVTDICLLLLYMYFYLLCIFVLHLCSNDFSNTLFCYHLNCISYNWDFLRTMCIKWVQNGWMCHNSAYGEVYGAMCEATRKLSSLNNLSYRIISNSLLLSNGSIPNVHGYVSKAPDVFTHLTQLQ